MPTSPAIPLLEVATTLLTLDGRILAVFNKEWGLFTLPMTKRRTWEDPNTTDGRRTEDWGDAATRCATEWVLCTSTTTPTSVLEIPQYYQSDRDGTWKRYAFHVFRMPVDVTMRTAIRRKTEWLTADQFLDQARRPISATARFVIGEIGSRRLL